MTTATFPAYIDALTATLAARPGLAGVTVASAPLGDEDDGKKAIVFVDCTTTADWAALGRQRQDEGYTVKGVVLITKGGAGQAVAKTARNEASALLTEIKTALTDNPTQNVAGVLHSRVSAEDWVQGIGDGTRFCAVKFDVFVKARI